MKSNDQIPEDEMLLAEALAAAEAADMEWATGAPFKSVGMRVEPDDDDADACCALGALHLAGRIDMTGRITASSDSRFCGVIHGNDDPIEPWRSCNNDEGESLGWAFRCAMTQDESDPATEALLRERGSL